jgi:hypothetical protein
MKIIKTLLLSFSALCLPWFASSQNKNVTDEVPATTDETPELDSDCPLIWIEFCVRESNRYCYIDGNEDKKCGTCLPGFVEFQARCISEDKVGIVEFLEEYAPEYLQPMSLEDRYLLLLEVITFIVEHQSRNPPPPYELGLNLFSADSEEDTKDRLGFIANLTIGVGDDLEPMNIVQSSGAPQSLPGTKDWVEDGAVTSVKDQGRCGCCWAVTVAGVIEGAAAVHNGFLQSLSYQQFISCDEQNFGCNGGNLVYALIYSLKSQFGGVASLGDYGYSDYDGKTTTTCKTSGKEVSVKLEGGSYVVDFYDTYSFQERLQRMKEAVFKQPVAIVIRSNCRTISNYKKGIITEDEECACNDPTCPDHAVLLVGYDDTSNPPSWKIKNSWSTNWGEDGYFRVAQIEKGRYGLFGMLLHGVVPNEVYNVTLQGAEPEQDDDGLEWWVYLLIALGVLGLACFCCACVFGRNNPKGRKG